MIIIINYETSSKIIVTTFKNYEPLQSASTSLSSTELFVLKNCIVHPCIYCNSHHRKSHKSSRKTLVHVLCLIAAQLLNLCAASQADLKQQFTCFVWSLRSDQAIEQSNKKPSNTPIPRRAIRRPLLDCLIAAQLLKQKPSNKKPSNTPIPSPK